MLFLTIIWSLFALAVTISLIVILHLGASATLVFVKENSDAIKITLALVAAIYTAGVLHIEIRDSRIANTLAFQEKSHESKLSEAFATLNMFWIRGEGRQMLADYRRVENTAKDPKIISKANNLWANQTKNAVLHLQYQDEIFLIFEHYRNIVVCVKQGRCHKSTACELFSNDIENFRTTYSEFLFDWKKLWRTPIEEALMDFRSGCTKPMSHEDNWRSAMP